MSKVFTSKEFINKLKWLVNDVPNKYYSGKLWLTYDKSDNKFRMDCVLSVKGILWGFSANKNDYRGGAKYCSNGVPDFTCNGALNYCSDVSTKFDNLVPGEYLCMKGTKYNHTGIYLGNGDVFECTTGWGTKRCIISHISSDGTRSYKGVKNLRWTYHGKMPWIDYSGEVEPVNQVKLLQAKLNQQWNCGLAVDGSFGPLTTKACNQHQLYYGVKAEIMVRWLQNRLKELGYKDIAVDGSFGPDTNRKVKDYQKKMHLKVDGYVGPATYRALTE